MLTTAYTSAPPRKRLGVALFAAAVTFLTYASVYGYRKGFTICTFDGMAYAGVSYKVWLVITQVLGYACSKFYGIRFIAELKRLGRGKTILLLTSVSWSGLLLFAVIPAPWNIPCMFLNGFPLGMIWGIVFSFVEGRMATDFIGAALSVSFIFSSGFVKSVAETLKVSFGMPEKWIPFATGAVFSLPLILFVFLLEKVPAPSEEDRVLRNNRAPMSRESRKQFVRAFLPGLIAVVAVYVFSTLFRDLRDNFMADMWKEAGMGNQPVLFTKTETPISLVLLAMMGSMILLKNNLKALVLTHYIIIAGFIITAVSSYLFIKGMITPFWWLTLVGLGLYATYIPFNCIFFERLIATFRFPGNVGFLIYVADSFGYLASVGVLVTKEMVKIKISWTHFYSVGVVIGSFFGIAGTVMSLIYFRRKYERTILANV